jgi:hypothetical protein
MNGDVPRLAGRVKAFRFQARSQLLDDFKLEIDGLAANDVAEISLPEATKETQGGIAVAAVDEKFQPEGAPEFEQRDADEARAQAHVAVESEVGAIAR